MNCPPSPLYFSTTFYMGGHIFILRHGPTYFKGDTEMLNTELFTLILPKITQFINQFGKINHIYTSSKKRCVDTAKLLADRLGVASIKKTNKLRRLADYANPDKIIDSIYDFGERIRNTDENIILITHSSTLIHVIRAVTGIYAKKPFFEISSLTVYDVDKHTLICFNKGWN